MAAEVDINFLKRLYIIRTFKNVLSQLILLQGLGSSCLICFPIFHAVIWSLSPETRLLLGLILISVHSGELLIV